MPKNLKKCYAQKFTKQRIRNMQKKCPGTQVYVFFFRTFADFMHAFVLLRALIARDNEYSTVFVCDLI